MLSGDAGRARARGGSDQLVAFFPAVIDGKGGVYVSFASDGLHWSRPERLLESPTLNARSTDHPAGLVEHRDGAISIWILRNVDVTETTFHADRSYIWGRGFDNGEMHCGCTPKYPPTLCAYRHRSPRPRREAGGGGLLRRIRANATRTARARAWRPGATPDT